MAHSATRPAQSSCCYSHTPRRPSSAIANKPAAAAAAAAAGGGRVFWGVWQCGSRPLGILAPVPQPMQLRHTAGLCAAAGVAGRCLRSTPPRMMRLVCHTRIHMHTHTLTHTHVHPHAHISTRAQHNTHNVPAPPCSSPPLSRCNDGSESL